MKLFHEKRLGAERRSRGLTAERNPDRRINPDRRQTALQEISYIEWARHFAKYRGAAISIDNKPEQA